MGLFTKTNEEKVMDIYEKMDETERQALIEKLMPKKPDEQPNGVADEGGEEPPAEEPKTEDAQNVGNVPSAKPEEQHKETFEEAYARLSKQSFDEVNKSVDDKFEALRKEMDEKLEPFVKRFEKKPFGEAEKSKEYNATAPKTMTSKEYIEKLFK